jgi:hypothetical protein
VLALLSLATLFGGARADQPSSESSVDGRLQQQCLAFRAEVEGAYRLNYDQPPVKAAADLKKVTLKFIPEGSKFRDAEECLRVAGFGVTTDASHFPADPKLHRGYVYASLKVATKGELFKNSGVEIYLRPLVDQDFSKIGSIEAREFTVLP